MRRWKSSNARATSKVDKANDHNFVTFALDQSTSTMNKVKGLPYGISDFTDLRRAGCYYTDKTQYIPTLERTGHFLFLIRPRRFGKSVFLSMLAAYYDLARQDKFDQLFDGLWIKDNPTEEKGQYQVIYLDFSQATVGLDGTLKQKFDRYCSTMYESFADKYASYYDADFVQEVRRREPDSCEQLRYICKEAKDFGHQLYLIIDEYDNFTNNVLNEEGEEVYHALTHASGFYREVFKIYKANFQRILMMGVSPVTLDDLTSGFNIALNITTDPDFNMMLGFSETDVRQMIAYYREAGLIKADTEEMIDEMKPWYDNYCFAKASLSTDPKMFNSDMVIYYLRHHVAHGASPEKMLDTNTRTDYKKLKRLVELQGMSDRERGYIQQIAAEGTIVADVHDSFPAERIFDEGNFISLLYYYGMLTIVGTKLDQLVLGIPNNNVRKQYYEYILTESGRDVTIDLTNLRKAFHSLALNGEIKPALSLIAEAYKQVSSVRSGMQGERNLQGFICAYLSLTPLYLIAPEVEMSHGYCDIFLMPDKKRYPEVVHSYIVELKYLTAKDTDTTAEEQWQQAAEQVRLYTVDRKVQQMTVDTELHLVRMQMRMAELVRIEEVSR